MSVRSAESNEGGITATGPRAWLHELLYRLSLRTVCGMGYGYPAGLVLQSKQNCRQPATVRTRVADKYEWHYYCDEHSKWPWKDRSWWREHSFQVERREDAEWVPWNDFEIHAPEAYRRYGVEGDK